jgi:glutamate/aspartate transport system permease protein
MRHFDLQAIWDALPYLFKTGMTFTLMLTLTAGFFGLVLGTLLAIARTSSVRWVAALAGAYVNLMRSVPLILVIFWFYFLAPYAGAWLIGSSTPVPVGAVQSAILTFTLFEAAYFCEIVRAGLNSIPAGQTMAGLALGLRPSQIMTWVVVPQALRNMTPALLTRLITLFQDTSLVYVVGLTDFLGAASKIGERDDRVPELYVFVAATYFVICFGASRLVRRLNRTELSA